jgi:hypothetical protein
MHGMQFEPCMTERLQAKPRRINLNELSSSIEQTSLIQSLNTSGFQPFQHCPDAVANT